MQPTVGKIVHWFSGADRRNGGNAAIVTAVNQDSVRLAVFQPGSPGIRATSWVRHVDDPWNETHRRVAEEQGGWDWACSEDMPQPELVWTETEVEELSTTQSMQPVEIAAVAAKAKRRRTHV